MSASTAPMPPVDPIQAAIELAQATAKSAVEAQMRGLAPPGLAANANVPAPVRPGVPLSMDDMAGAGGLAVDGWIGVNEFGLVAGPKKDLVTSRVVVDIDLTAVAPNYAIKFGKAPVTYYKTYDRVIEARGGSWADAVARAQRADPGAREYPSVDVPMTVTADMLAKKEVLAAAGTTVGYSVATTGWNNWKKFYAECVKQGLAQSTVRVELESEKRTGNGNTWGIIAWKLLPAA